MPAGLQVIGDHGVVQIDENYTNYALKYSGRTFIANRATLTLNGLVNPILCLRTPEGRAVFVSSNQSFPDVTYTLITGLDSQIGTTVEWYLFDQTVSADSGTGLSVYRADGSIAYNTSWKVMKVGAVAQVRDIGDNEMPGDAEGRVAAPYAGKWAVCLSSARGAIVPDGSGRLANFLYDGVVTDDTGAQTGVVEINRIPWRSEDGVQPGPLRGGVLILVDVSNISP